MKLGSFISASSFLSLSILGCTIAAALAPATTHARTERVQTVVLRQVEIDKKPKARHVAVVRLDLVAKMMTVEITNDICGQYSLTPRTGRSCLAMPTPIEEITLPYSKTIDSCGSVTYQASQDLRPADGRKVEVAFVDSSNMTCEIAPVDVQTLSVKIVNARGKRTSYTAVNKLQVGSEDPSVRDDAAIYEALNVEEEVLNPGIAGRSRTRKSVGGLVCTKSVLAAPRATPGYTCKLAN